MLVPPRVLVVDDSADDVRLLTRVLTRAILGVTWRHVDTALGLRDALAAGPWDAVLCDHGVPGLPTADVVARARAAMPGVPVIVVSGSDAPAAPAAARAAGARAFVRKDRLEQLPAVIGDVLGTASRSTPAKPAGPAPAAGPEPRLRAVLDCLFDGVFVTDAEGHVRYANARAGALVGCPPEALIGAALPMRLGSPAVGDDLLGGATLRRRDGSSVPTALATVLVPGGGADERLWVVRDLTAVRRGRARLEARIRCQREELAESAARAAQLARLIGGLRCATRCRARLLAAGSAEQALRAVARELSEASGLGWSAASAWVRQPAAGGGPDAAGLWLDPRDVLAPLPEGDRKPIPVAGPHPYAAVLHAGELELDHDGELLAPLRSRVGPRGVLALRWDAAARRPEDTPLRAGIGEVARDIADALGLALEWHALLRLGRTRTSRDPLGRLTSGRALPDRLRRALAKCERDRLDLAVVALACEGLRGWAETLDDASRDRLREAVAGHLLRTTGGPEHAFRVGPEAFVLLLPGAGPRAALATVERLRRRLTRTLGGTDPDHPPVSISAGVAVRDAGESGEALLARADAARRVARSHLGNGVVLDSAQPARR